MGLSIAIALSLAPVLGDEAPIDPPVSVPAFRLDRAPALTWTGAEWLGAWQHVGLRGAEIRAGRVAPDGAALDPFAPLVAGDEGRFPAIACAATACLVAWIGGEPATIRAVRVTTGGVPIEEPWELIPAPIATTQSPSLARHGDGWLVVWGGDFGATRVAPDGTILDPFGLPVFAQGTDVAVASGDGASLILWVDTGRVWGRRVDAAGTVLDATPIAVSLTTTPELPAAAWLDGAWLVAWNDGVQSRIRAARVDSDGTVLDATPIDLTDNLRWRMAPAVAATGATWIVAWLDACDLVVSAARIDRGGALLDPIAFTVSTERVGWDGVPRSGRPAAAADPTGTFAIAWPAVLPGGDPVDGFHVQLGRVSAVDGARLDDPAIVIGLGANDQRGPAVAAEGGRFLVAWSDYRNGRDADLRAALRLASDPGPSVSFELATVDGTQANAAAARLGDGWVVAWSDTRSTPQPDVLAARLDAEGNLLATDLPIAVGAGSQIPLAAASLTTNGAIILVDDRGQLATVVVTNGSLASYTGLPTGTPAIAASAAGAAHSGLVLWSDGDGVYASIVAEGREPNAIRLGDAMPGTRTAAAPGGIDPMWRAVWSTGETIYTQALRIDGTPVGAPIEIATGAPERLAIAWDGTRFVIAAGTTLRFIGAYDVDPEDIEIAIDPSALACDDGDCVLARDGFDPTVAADRVRVRSLTASPDAPADAGIPSVDAEALDAATPPPPLADCGCRAGSGRSGARGWIWLLAIALALRRATTNCPRDGE